MHQVAMDSKSEPTRKGLLKITLNNWAKGGDLHLPVTPLSLAVLPPSGISPAWVDQVPNRGLSGACRLPLQLPVLALSPAVLWEASHAWRVTGCPPHFCRDPSVLPGHMGMAGGGINWELKRPLSSQGSHHDGQLWV